MLQMRSDFSRAGIVEVQTEGKGKEGEGEGRGELERREWAIRLTYAADRPSCVFSAFS